MSCVKVKVAVMGSQSLIVRTVSVDVKEHWTQIRKLKIEPREHFKRKCLILTFYFDLCYLLDNFKN